MDWRREHEDWLHQVGKLKETLLKLTSTDPKNLIQHFFLQAIEQEFGRELESYELYQVAYLCCG